MVTVARSKVFRQRATKQRSRCSGGKIVVVWVRGVGNQGVVVMVQVYGGDREERNFRVCVRERVESLNKYQIGKQFNIKLMLDY